MRWIVRARLDVASPADAADALAALVGGHTLAGRTTIRARITVGSGSAASTIAREWGAHGGRAVVVEVRGLVRYVVDRYGSGRRWWWSR